MKECEYCNQQKADVRKVIHPYEKEINETELWVNMCDECYLDSVQDI